METLFQFEDYKEYLREEIKRRSQGQKGLLKKIAAHLKVHSSLLSQILRGPKHLTYEQAYLVTEFFGIEGLAAKYFINLVQKERAGSAKLRNFIEAELATIKSEYRLREGSAKDHPLDLRGQTQFYSQWYYAAVHLLTTIDQYADLETIASKTGLPLDQVREVVDFLFAIDYCRREKGKIRANHVRTHLVNPVLLNRHHTNWRLKAMEKMAEPTSPNRYFYTIPMSLEEKDSPRIKELLMKLVKEVDKIVDTQNPDKVACLNIDWFDF
jgi:uncharacterized protein (TIGR02147 family)